MNKTLQQWHDEFSSMDTKENHRAQLRELEAIFMEHPEADNAQARTRMLWLLNHFEKAIDLLKK